MSKVGVNEPCPCGKKKEDGTPLKYKKCCMNKNQPSPEDLEKIRAWFISKQREKEVLEEKGIFINYVKPVQFRDPQTGKDGSVWALGNKVFNFKGRYLTFHMFILEYLKDTLGREWWVEQLQSQEKHFLFKCFVKYDEWMRKNQKEENRVDEHTWFAYTDGWAKTLSSLAFDVCSLQHTQQLPDHLLARLRNKDEYQGAHYEIAVASIFARLGCKIDFLDDKKSIEKHCEFIATHEKTKVSIAVEAKSRRRAGIKHQAGSATQEKLVDGYVKRLLNDALKQNPKDIPFVIFIDLNTPLTPNIKVEEKKWVKDIQRMMEEYPEPTKEIPEEYAGLFFTNFSPHYNEENQSAPNEFISVFPLFATRPLPSQQFTSMLFSAVTNYGFVPNVIQDKGIEQTTAGGF